MINLRFVWGGEVIRARLWPIGTKLHLGNRDTPRKAMDVNVAGNGTGVGVGTAVIARHDPLSIYLA